MTTPRAFISFDYDNNLNEKYLFSGQCKNSRVPFDIKDWSSKERIPQNEWEREIKDKINKMFHFLEFMLVALIQQLHCQQS